MQSQSMIQLADAMRQQSREGCFDLAREQLISDCEAITSNLGDLKSRAETDINYFVARISAKEVEKTGEQSNQLQLLNYIVFILGLISALAAILAIEKRSKYTLAFVIASTLAIITIVIAKSFRHIHAFAMRGLQIIGGMRKKSDQDGNPFDFVQVCSLYRVKSS